MNTPAFLNVHASKRHISRMLCGYYRKQCCSNDHKNKGYTCRADFTELSIMWQFPENGGTTEARILGII